MRNSTFFALPLNILQLGTAVAVLCITAIRLQEISSWGQVSSIWNSSRQVCYMGPNVASATLCRYTYAVGAISILLTICIGLLQLITCNMGGCGKYVDGVFTVLLAIWWLVAGFVLADSTRRADSAGVPAAAWRRTVVILSWVTAGLFAALFMVHASRMCASCCNKRRRGGDVEKALGGGGSAGGPRTPSAAVELGNEIRNRPYMQRGGAQQGLGGPNI